MQHDLNRHHMKAVYQRNMLLAHLSVIGLIGMGLLALLVTDRPSDTAYRNTRVVESPIVIRDTGIVQRDSTRNAKRLLPVLNPYAIQHDGFLGFVDLRPVHAASEPMLAPIPVVITAPEFTPDESIISYSLSEGADTGVFVPEDVELMPVSDSVSESAINRSAQLLYSVKPEIPPIAEWNRKEGYVEVLLLVDSLGNQRYFACRQEDQSTVSGPTFSLDVVVKGEKRGALEFYYGASQENSLLYVTLDERPKEYHFAEYLTKVLPQWKFAPAIRDSRPVTGFVVIQYRFCYESDTGCQKVLLRSVL